MSKTLMEMIRSEYAKDGYTVTFDQEIIVLDTDIEFLMKNTVDCDFNRAKKTLQQCNNSINDAIEEIKRVNHNNSVFNNKK